MDVNWLDLLELIKDRAAMAVLFEHLFHTDHMLYKCNGKLK